MVPRKSIKYKQKCNHCGILLVSLDKLMPKYVLPPGTLKICHVVQFFGEYDLFETVSSN